MKKLIFLLILLTISINVNAATFRTSVAGGSTSGTGDRTVAITPVVGDLFVVVCFVSTNTNDTPTVTDTNTGGTYTRVNTANVTISTVAHRLSLHVRNATVPNTTSTTATCVTGSNTSGIIHVVAIAGMTRTGAAAIRSSGLQNNQSAGTPAPALNISALTGNFTMVSVGSADTATIPNASWTERHDSTFATPTIATNTSTRDSGFTGTTITSGDATSTTFASFALELDTSVPVGGKRRIINI